jgi:hypothetical protein
MEYISIRGCIAQQGFHRLEGCLPRRWKWQKNDVTWDELSFPVTGNRWQTPAWRLWAHDPNSWKSVAIFPRTLDSSDLC